MAIAKKPKPEPAKPAAKPAPAKAASSKAVAKIEPKSTALAQALDEQTLMQDGQADNTTFGKDDLATPFLRILQSLSPQVQKGDEKYVDGAEVGMFFDTADQELWEGEEDGIVVAPIHYTPSFIEWKLRDNGGGLVKDWGAVAPDLVTTRDEKNREILPNGNQLVKSGLYYVAVINPETAEFKFLAFPLQGMQLKKSRAWNTRIKSIRQPKADGTGLFKPAMYYTTWKLTTAFEKNDKGSWYGVAVEPHKTLPELFPDNPALGWGIYVACRDFKEMIAQGRVKTATVEAEVIDEESGEGDGAF